MGGPARSPCLRLEEVHLGERLRGVSLEFGRGDCAVVVGPNGAGKSTLLRTLLGLERAERGRVLLDSRPLHEFTPGERAAHVAWLPQRPRLGESLRVDELVASARYRFGEARGEALAHARRALAEVGAESLAERHSDRISGGELQRALLATLLAQAAPLLLVDEPANHLDPAQQVAIYRRLGKLRRRGFGLLVVTHDINLASLLGPPEEVRVLGLQAGQIVLDAPLSAPDLPERLGELYAVRLAAVDVSGTRFLLVERDANDSTETSDAADRASPAEDAPREGT